MIDQFFQNAAENVLEFLTSCITFFSNLFQTNIFQTMTPREIQISCIKLALEALALAAVLWLGNRDRRSKKSSTAKQAPQKVKRGKAPVRKWTPTGWYWDDKKEKWIPPDYINKEAQERWRWDPKKQIWIDLKQDKD